MDPIRRDFVQSFINFLDKEILQQANNDSKESLEIAKDCLFNVFCSNIPKDNGQYLVTDLFELFKNAFNKDCPDRKTKAEELKNVGNQLMKEEKFNEALEYYTTAISLDATNPVFYSNRAATWNKMGEEEKAIEDCKLALRYNSNYTKAYARMGAIYAKIEKYMDSRLAYEKALELEPTNEEYKKNLGIVCQKIEEQTVSPAPEAATDVTALLNTIMNEPNFRDLVSRISSTTDIESIMSASRHLLSHLQELNLPLFGDSPQQNDL